jgi:hypothetical protein
MPRDRFKLAEIAQKHWVRGDEQIVWAVESKGARHCPPTP